MPWWKRGLTVAEQAILEQQRQNAEMQAANIDLMRTMVEHVGTQAKLVQGYLEFFTKSAAPEVRLMTDHDEARHEAARNMATQAMGGTGTPQHPVDMESWMHQMNMTFDEVKRTF